LANSSLFSNHGNVILVLADDPESRLRDVASRVGITERAVQKIVRDLQLDGLLTVVKHGRRNRYRINTRKVLQHPLATNRTVGQLLNLMRDGESGRPEPKPASRAAPKPDAAADSEVHADVASAPVPAAEAAADLEGAQDQGAAPAGETPAGADELPAAASTAKKKKTKRRSSPDEQQGSLF
jgi:hypothetical protein